MTPVSGPLTYFEERTDGGSRVSFAFEMLLRGGCVVGVRTQPPFRSAERTACDHGATSGSGVAAFYYPGKITSVRNGYNALYLPVLYR